MSKPYVEQKFDDVNSQLASKASQVDLIATNAEVDKKINRDEIGDETFPLTVANWTYLYANLPAASLSNKSGYLYCTDGDGSHGAGKYYSNGTSWYFGGTGDQGYNILKEDLGKLQTNTILGTMSFSGLINTYNYKLIKSDLLKSGTTIKFVVNGTIPISIVAEQTGISNKILVANAIAGNEYIVTLTDNYDTLGIFLKAAGSANVSVLVDSNYLDNRFKKSESRISDIKSLVTDLQTNSSELGTLLHNVIDNTMVFSFGTVSTTNGTIIESNHSRGHSDLISVKKGYKVNSIDGYTFFIAYYDNTTGKYCGNSEMWISEKIIPFDAKCIIVIKNPTDTIVNNVNEFQGRVNLTKNDESVIPLNNWNDIDFTHANKIANTAIEAITDSYGAVLGTIKASTICDLYQYIKVNPSDEIYLLRPRFINRSAFGTVFFDTNLNPIYGKMVSYNTSLAYGFQTDKFIVPDNCYYMSTVWYHDTVTYGNINGYIISKQTTNISNEYLEQRFQANRMRNRLYEHDWMVEDLDKGKLLLSCKKVNLLPSKTFHGVSEYGQLKVIGKNLCDKNGNPVQLRGVSIWDIPEGSQCAIRESLETVKKYGGNIVRIILMPVTYSMNGYLEGSKNYIRPIIEQMIKDCIELDMYVLLDWHILLDGNPLSYLNDANEFFNEISNEYAKNPAIIYEPCNEPHGTEFSDAAYAQTWEWVKTYANTIIPTIRKNSPNAVIIMGTPRSCTLMLHTITDPLPFTNIMYSFHWYKGYVLDSMQNAVNNSVPVFVTESGAKDASDTTSIGTSASYDITNYQAMLTYCKQNNISWIAWALFIGNHHNPTTFFKDEYQGSALPYYGGWTSELLNDYGKTVFNNLDESYTAG